MGASVTVEEHNEFPPGNFKTFPNFTQKDAEATVSSGTRCAAHKSMVFGDSVEMTSFPYIKEINHEVVVVLVLQFSIKFEGLHTPEVTFGVQLRKATEVCPLWEHFGITGIK
jgi:hypothetical protein